jgi:dTMP kinase
MFFAFEGGEGAGKSTIITMVADKLRQMGRTVVISKNPGGTEIGSEIRETVLKPRSFNNFAPITEVFLYYADRAQQVHEIIRPALARGDIVITDRFNYSTIVYQGYGRGLPLDMLWQITEYAIGDTRPDQTIIFDIDPELGFERVRSRAAKGTQSINRLETEKIDFYNKLRKGYLEIAADKKNKATIIDASKGIEEVFEQVWKVIEGSLQSPGV